MIQQKVKRKGRTLRHMLNQTKSIENLILIGFIFGSAQSVRIEKLLNLERKKND